MPAYLIVNYDVTDEDALMQYREQAVPVLIGEGRGKLLSTDAASLVLPESTDGGTHTVVIQFETKDRAMEVYRSEAYKPMIQARQAATRPCFALIVEGV